MAGKAQALLSLLFTKFDVAFTLGRLFGLLPVMLMSHMTTDAQLLAHQISAYQIALFVSTVVLYGAPQVYLFKLGMEQRVFVFHMAISSALVGAVLLMSDTFQLSSGLFPAFLFLVFFRSYYLLFASYLKFDARRSILQVGWALVVLAVYALSLSYVLATLVAVPFTLWQIYDLGYARVVYAAAALRGYFRLLRTNFSYYYNYLIQQTYSQIVLAIYAFVETGTPYLQAAHAVYIYAISFIFHGILFRLTLANMGRTKGAEGTRQHLFRNFRISMAVGIAAALTVVLFYRSIERILFGSVELTATTAAMLGAMIILNSSNFGWAALLTSQRRPFLLAVIGTLATGTVVVGIFVQDALTIPNGIFVVMLLGLTLQAGARYILGMRVLKAMGS